LKLGDIFASNPYRNSLLNPKRLMMSPGKISIYSAVLCCTLLVIAPFGAGAQGAPPPAVVGTNVNLRQGPGTSYTVITLIPAGTPVNVSGCNAGWCQVTSQGQNGYIIATALGPPSGAGGPPPGAVAGGPVYVGPGGPPPGYIPPPPPYYGYSGPYYGPYGYGYGPRPYWRGGYYGYRRW
jgi:SH3-like domain-containing protein